MDAMLIIVIVGIAAVLGTVAFVGMAAVAAIYGGRALYAMWQRKTGAERNS